MVSQQKAELTEEEAALYDRQIRLWGIESQKRLRNARILVIGVGGFGAEIVKNIVLSGVKSVTMLDHRNASEIDKCAQFLVPPDSIGKPRAEASLARAQALNPMVEVKADTSSVEKKPDEFFADFDVVVATGCQVSLLSRINTACRLKGVKFFAGDVFGMFGYFFLDLMQHEYTKIDQPKKFVQTYVPLVEALGVEWTSPQYEKRLSKMDYSFFLMLVLQEFVKKYQREPKADQHDEDVQRLINLASELVNQKIIPSGKIPPEIFNCVFAEISPVCAILGGLLSQEIIRAVSNVDPPINNFFFFNPEKCLGFVETVTGSA